MLLTILTFIYHITHINNLLKIVQEGGLWSDAECRRQRINGQSIGYAHIKQRRMNRAVPLAPGGNLGEYVPFYFAPRSPMLFTIERHNTDYKGGQEPVVHLVSSADAVSCANPALQWVFTEGHAEIAFSQFFNHLQDLNTIDWKTMDSYYLIDTDEDNDRKRLRLAEYLVDRFF